MQNSVARKLLGDIGMTWNYRVVRFTNDVVGEYYEVKEVFYDKLGELAGYSEASVFSDTFEGLNGTLELMSQAISKPVIDDHEFFDKGEKA